MLDALGTVTQIEAPVTATEVSRREALRFQTLFSGPLVAEGEVGGHGTEDSEREQLRLGAMNLAGGQQLQKVSSVGTCQLSPLSLP